jgi:hypothetical protein
MLSCGHLLAEVVLDAVHAVLNEFQGGLVQWLKLLRTAACPHCIHVFCFQPLCCHLLPSLSPKRVIGLVAPPSQR